MRTYPEFVDTLVRQPLPSTPRPPFSLREKGELRSYRIFDFHIVLNSTKSAQSIFPSQFKS
ncbi:MAG: hypothetical protein AMXMBFR75_00320 [Candidatus Hinthialibacteria bacterium]